MDLLAQLSSALGIFGTGLSQHARLITLASAQESALPEALSTSTDSDLDQFIGEEMTVTLQQPDGSRRAWHGLCIEAAWLGADGGVARYRLRLELALALLRRRRDSYIFQDKTVQDIVTELLSDYPQLRFEFDVKQDQPTRTICTQYRESDLEFFTSLLALEGLPHPAKSLRNRNRRMESQSNFQELDPWRSRQAAMLYHYASLDYLKTLARRIDIFLTQIVEPLLHIADIQKRDKLFTSEHWGERDTSENWENYAWPIFKDLQQSIAKQIAMRSFEAYGPTGVDEYIRGVEQFSMLWASEEEEDAFSAALQAIVKAAGEIDDTLDDETESRWDDHAFAYSLAKFAKESPRIPRFRIRHDIRSETGKPAPRAGVYVSASDPYAALQFAYPGPPGCKLREASTFNEVGLEALNTLGRESLWFDEDKMFDFAMNSQYAKLFSATIIIGSEVFKDLASSSVAQHAFTNEHSEWYFVEKMGDNEIETLPIWSHIEIGNEGLRVLGGSMCETPGYYLSPSKVGSRTYFNAGEVMPEFETDYGITVWQFDVKQD